jgi:hypothetical protein
MKKKKVKTSFVVISRDERGRFCKHREIIEPVDSASFPEALMRVFGCALSMLIILTLIIVGVLVIGILHW